jgi:Lar family restriction alleviation protein
MFGKPQMIHLSRELQAEKAIAHTLQNICDRPGVAWYLGHGTQTYELLTEALATLSGKGMDEIQSIYQPAQQPTYSAANINPCPFCGSQDFDIKDDDEIHFVICKSCNSAGPPVEEFMCDSRMDAISSAVRKWNDRKMPR